MRIVAEHTRAAAFLIGDDKTPVLPSNEERGYAVRRVLRRAVYYGRHYLGLDRPFMAEVTNAAVETMGQAYPELRQQQEFALRIIQPEEERFEETLSRGKTCFQRTLPAHQRVRLIKMVAEIERGNRLPRTGNRFPLNHRLRVRCGYDDRLDERFRMADPWSRAPLRQL